MEKNACAQPRHYFPTSQARSAVVNVVLHPERISASSKSLSVRGALSALFSILFRPGASAPSSLQFRSR